MCRARIRILVEPLAPDDVQSVTNLSFDAAPGVCVGCCRAIIVNPHPVVAPIAVYIFEPHAAGVTHAFAGEALAQRLPVCRDVFDPSVPPACDVAVIRQHTVVGAAIAVDVSKTHMRLIVSFRTLPEPDIGEGWRLVPASIPVSIVDACVGSPI